MLLYQSLILGVMQGIAEWLPISSSGHLVLAQKIMNIDVPVSFDVWLHFSTLLALVVFFRQDIWKITKAIAGWKTEEHEFRLALLIIISTIATSLVVFPLKGLFGKAFSNLTAVGIGFAITGFLLLFSEKNQKENRVGIKAASLIGLMQGIAFLPGISRSGSTISAALISGVKKEEAFKFSFLIAIPAILGSAILETPNLMAEKIPGLILGAGFISAFVLGLASLFVLREIIYKKRFHYFAYYCFAIAIITFIIQILLKG